MRTTIVEFPEFIRCAIGVLSETDKQALIDYLSVYPRSGVELLVRTSLKK
jgi:hypothetical protein